MNYLTNYYKNLSEQLQEKVNHLTKLLQEAQADERTYFASNPNYDYEKHSDMRAWEIGDIHPDTIKQVAKHYSSALEPKDVHLSPEEESGRSVAPRALYGQGEGSGEVESPRGYNRQEDAPSALDQFTPAGKLKNIGIKLANAKNLVKAEVKSGGTNPSDELTTAIQRADEVGKGQPVNPANVMANLMNTEYNRRTAQGKPVRYK